MDTTLKLSDRSDFVESSFNFRHYRIIMDLILKSLLSVPRVSLLYLFLILSCERANSQAKVNYIPVYSYISENGISLEQSIGDVFVNSQATEKGLVTEGFLQPRYEIISISEKDTASPYEVNLFPNPFSSQLQISIRELVDSNNGKPLTITWTLFNLWGIIVRTGFKNTEATMVSLDLEDLNPGQYVIKITINKQPYLYKIIKL